MCISRLGSNTEYSNCFSFQREKTYKLQLAEAAKLLDYE